MLRVFKLISLVVLLIWADAAWASHDLTHVLQGINERYSHLSALSVSYTREVITGTMSMLGDQAKGDLASGRIYFQAPYSLRLEQETPRPETIISNGQSFWWYLPHKKQAYQYHSPEFGRELRMLSNIFRGLSDVKDTFDVKMLGQNGRDEYLIELRPNPPWEQIDHVIITVTSAYAIRVVSSYNPLGTITRFILKGLEKREKFAPGFFEFVLPKGVQHIEEKGS